ncbi:hypothetical protein J4481_01240 [Candidatus Pacearchaeota archaeon]|nr:hypothetical protein [Candidatus Pacearchaeota archaeon]
MTAYKGIKFAPLTKEEIAERYAEVQEEMGEVLEWKKEEEARLVDENVSPQARSAAKRALKKVARRINTVKGTILYWKLRNEGQSHFKANLEKNELWASLSESDKSEE